MDDVILKLTIPLSPVTKKNDQRILINKKTNRPFVMPSEKYSAYEKNAITLIKDYIKGSEILPIDFRVNVKCIFYRQDHRKCDLTNLQEAIDDVLVRAGVLEDDNFTVIASHDGSRVKYDKDYPRTEVVITEFIEEGGSYDD